MVTPVFLTVDTELVWRHHVGRLDAATLIERSFEPAGVGVAYQLGMLRRHCLKACFFVDPMPALVFGLEPFRRIVGQILDAGQEVQLHCHPQWKGAVKDDGGKAFGHFEITDLGNEEQRDLLAEARDLLERSGAPTPVAYRGGSFSANDDTLSALASLGFAYDSSHNGAFHPWPSQIGLPPAQIAPIEHCGLVEVPVTVVEDRVGALRTFQICALSSGEMQAALAHAISARHAALTIVTHGFELANRAGTRPNAVHVGRFVALCNALDAQRDELQTQHFADRPRIALGQKDVPLAPSAARLYWRQAEQFWSNMVEERSA